ASAHGTPPRLATMLAAMNAANESPAYVGPNRHAELPGFDGEYRVLRWIRDVLELLPRRWQLARRGDLRGGGCGAGVWALTVLGPMPSEARLTGVDAEPSCLARAHERATARGQSDRCRFELGRAEALPFADASFDVVCCQTLLIHVADASVAVAEMARVL